MYRPYAGFSPCGNATTTGVVTRVCRGRVPLPPQILIFFSTFRLPRKSCIVSDKHPESISAASDPASAASPITKPHLPVITTGGTCPTGILPRAVVPVALPPFQHPTLDRYQNGVLRCNYRAIAIVSTSVLCSYL